MGKRNLTRERERKRALARQQRMIAAAKRRRRNQIIAGISVGAVAFVGVIVVIVWAVLDARTDETPTAAETTETVETPAAESAAPEVPTPSGQATYTAVPDPALAEGREWAGELVTSVGRLGITLDGAAAPQATANFVELARDGYYDWSSCHRLTTDGIFVLQCGSLTFDGSDGPGYNFGPVENAPADEVFPVGTIAMARAESEDSQGAQFFIVYQESTIPGGYTVFGHVTSGLEAIEQVAAAGTVDGATDGQPATTVTIEQITLE
jgi:peptidyl-prolyl cis-trans isomerase B (cyclophilin B)